MREIASVFSDVFNKRCGSRGCFRAPCIKRDLCASKAMLHLHDAGALIVFFENLSRGGEGLRIAQSRRQVTVTRHHLMTEEAILGVVAFPWEFVRLAPLQEVAMPRAGPLEPAYAARWARHDAIVF